MYRLHVIGILGAEGWAALLCMWTSSFYNKEYTQSAGSHNSLYEKKKKQKTKQNCPSRTDVRLCTCNK